MKAVQVVSRGKLKFVETPVPELAEGEALIRPVRLSLCASDVYFIHYMDDSRYPAPPGTTGHEMVGIVEAVNGTHPEVKVGDLTLTIVPEHRAMAEYYVSPFKHVLPVPAGVSPEHLLQAQQLGTVIYACQQLPSLIGKNVVVIGQGSAGLWFNTMLKRLGAQNIISVDKLGHRLDLSKQFGATHTINNDKEEPIAAVKNILDGELADVVIEAVGEPETINLAIDLATEYAFMLQFGVPHQRQMQFNIREMFNKCITLKAIVIASREPNHTSTRIALNMIASGEVDAAPLLTHRFPFDQVEDAYELQRSRQDGAVKIIIDMPEKK